MMQKLLLPHRFVGCSRPFGARRHGARHPLPLESCRPGRAAPRRRELASRARTGQASSSTGAVAIEVEAPSLNSRKIRAVVVIRAPIHRVWKALTAYEALGTFIPGLVENRCLERWDGGCRLLQVGEQDVVAGLKFSARCVLHVEEHCSGVPADWRSSEVIVSFPSSRSRGFHGSSGSNGSSGSGSGSGSNGSSGSGSNGSSSGSSSSSSGGGGSSGGSNGSSGSGRADAWQPGAAPSSSGGSSSDEGPLCDAWECNDCRDISFQIIEGDFQAFKGIWRMQPGDQPATTLLSYSLFVRPQVWLPVGLVQPRIEREIVNNLVAVRDHVEGQWKRRPQVAAAARK